MDKNEAYFQEAFEADLARDGFVSSVKSHAEISFENGFSHYTTSVPVAASDMLECGFPLKYVLSLQTKVRDAVESAFVVKLGERNIAEAIERLEALGYKARDTDYGDKPFQHTRWVICNPLGAPIAATEVSIAPSSLASWQLLIDLLAASGGEVE